MKLFEFSVSISYQQFLSYYKGVASSVVVTSNEGVRLQIPASRLSPFLSQTGIHGRFQMIVTAQNKFVRIDRIN
ncbi:DUF2835 domain-containing protein [Vibrio sp.]|nr:DUF2835 domain-containing protein [Vibrio sp.]